MTPFKTTHLYELLTLILLALVITVLSPHDEDTFQYQVIQGKPWLGDELLVAPFNFPIYKSDEMIQRERDSVRQSILPYYQIDTLTGAKMLHKWEEEWTAKWSKEVSDEAYYYYMCDYLKDLYRNGIIEEETATRLRQDDVLEVKLLDAGQVSRLTPVTLFSTPMEAYQQASERLPQELSKSVIRKFDPSNYIQVNVYPNEAKTQQVIDDELRNLSKSVGVVQKGERIISKGEIVSPHQYDVLQSLRRVTEEQQGSSLRQALPMGVGTFLIIVSLLLGLWFFLFYYRPKIVKEYKNTLFFSLLILIFSVLTIIFARIELGAWVYAIPYVSVAILVRTFFESRTAVYAFLTTILICALYVPFALEFIIIQFIAGMLAVFSLRSLSSRAQIIRATFLIFVIYNVMTCSYSLMTGGALGRNDLSNLLYFSFNLIFNMFSYLLIYLIEKGFGYVSNITLVELSDVNRPLPRQLSEQAPGTFQHSMQMALLASDAATAIGADARLVRAGALYHDIGKMRNAAYFTENQGSINPHDQLTPMESAAVIIKHVTDGIAMAQKHNLPPAIQDFIRMHHGRGVTKYFYNEYCNAHPDETVDVDKFTYPGPNPNSKETGILMLADAIEASSRSLKDLSKETLIAHVNKIVDSIVADGLLNDTPLTFRDIQTIKDVFAEKLATIYHSRIAYPELKR
ncbi:MAG: HDIG domain-containing protein [Porphyromonas sp.]|uniref:HD family phosphohydrolase n=1 Tax=Porphyromonas sp. TaxID=1924944 RepID=UPI001A392538|nr:HDIG domain-containing metalloprotein [Porphyromonas sp.]MBL6452131.1 HDIG domain-containing protein [Porphyromonas sp.]